MPTGCCSCHDQSQVAGKVRHVREVVPGRDLAAGDADVGAIRVSETAVS